EDADVSARQADRLLGELRRVPDADDALHSGGGGACERGGGAAVETLQMRRGVDHAGGVSTRGKRGPPEASTGRPLPVPSTLRSKATSSPGSPIAASIRGAREGR